MVQRLKPVRIIQTFPKRHLVHYNCMILTASRGTAMTRLVLVGKKAAWHFRNMRDIQRSQKPTSGSQCIKGVFLRYVCKCLDVWPDRLHGPCVSFLAHGWYILPQHTQASWVCPDLRSSALCRGIPDDGIALVFQRHRLGFEVFI